MLTKIKWNYSSLTYALQQVNFKIPYNFLQKSPNGHLQRTSQGGEFEEFITSTIFFFLKFMTRGRGRKNRIT